MNPSPKAQSPLVVGADVLKVLRFCISEHKAGHHLVLCVLTGVYGGTLREKGALMAVSFGQNSNVQKSCGYISSGCVDGDIIFQAGQVLAEKKIRRISYGESSPFKDIRLPCGGRIDLALIPKPDMDAVEKLESQLLSRRVGGLYLEKGKLGFFTNSDTRPITKDQREEAGFVHFYAPRLRLYIAGRGEPARQLACLAETAGFESLLFSPDQALQKTVTSPFHLLTHAAQTPDFWGQTLKDDKWTAWVFLFHDHDWEIKLLQHALSGPGFYIGAMGSARTHALRKETLAGLKLTPAQITRIKAPIGLITRLRDANLLALSVLAEIIQDARAKDLI